MANYTARRDELQKAVREAQAKDMELERGGAPPIVLAHYVSMLAEVEAYIDWRDKALAESIQILKNESSSITGRDQVGRWSEFYNGRGAEAFKRFTEYVKYYNEPNLRLLGDATASQESQFFVNLGRMPLAWIQGVVQEYQATFEKERNNLIEKWRSQHDNGHSIEERATSVAQEIMEVFAKISDEILAARTSNEEVLISTFKAWREADDRAAPGDISIHLEIPNLIFDAVSSYKASRETLIQRFDEAYKSEETIVIVIDQTRKAVKEFLAKTNLTTARNDYEEACRNSKELIAQCPTNGQREDGQRFRELAEAEVKNFLGKFEEGYKKFVGEFKNIFVGPVGPAVIDDILAPRRIEEFVASVERTDIQAALQKLQNDVVLTWEVSLGGLTPEQRKDIENVWRVELERYTRGIKEVEDGTFRERLLKAARDSWLRLRLTLQSSEGAPEQ